MSALAHEDPDAADRTISRLSELLRLTLENSSRQEVLLKEEIDILGINLDILETRFEDRIKFRLEIESVAAKAPVLSFILQPLVENAVRHGIAPRREGVTVTIRAGQCGNQLNLTVSDNGPILFLSAIAGRFEALTRTQSHHYTFGTHLSR